MSGQADFESPILILDFGSSFLKAGLFVEGRSPSLFSIDYGSSSDGEKGDSTNELLAPRSYCFSCEGDSKLQSYLVAWKKLFTQIQTTMPVEFSQIQSILIATCSPSLVALNQEGKVVGKALFSSDFPKEARSRGGYYQTLATLILEQLTAEDFKAITSIDTFLSLGDFFTYLLCGKAITSTPTLSLASYLWQTTTTAPLRRSYPTLREFSFAPFVLSGTYLAQSDSPWAHFLSLSPTVKIYAGAFDYALDLLGANGFDSHQLILRGGTFPRINVPFLVDKESSSSTQCKSLQQKAKQQGWLLLPHPFATGFNLSRFWKESPDLEKSVEDLLLSLKQLKAMGVSIQTILYCGGGSCNPQKNQAIANVTQLPLVLLPIADGVLLGGYYLLTYQQAVNSLQETSIEPSSLAAWVKQRLPLKQEYQPHPLSPKK